MKHRMLIACICASSVVFSVVPSYALAAGTNTAYPYGRLERAMEELDRGLVAIRTDKGIYLSWRLMSDEDNIFGSAESNTSFEVYRDNVKIADVTDTTNYLDENGNMGSSYKVISSSAEESGTVTAFESGSNYFDIPLSRPAASPYGEYTINDTSVGDLDGDGEYELIVKWDSNGKDNSQSGTTGPVLLDAYHLNGDRLWDNPIDLGKNIRGGAHYTQFLVYDFDQDGSAEITCKTAPGSKDTNGRYVSEASLDEDIKSCDNSADYRNGGGYILDGDEYFTVFNGETGAATDTIYYPNQRLSAAVWGDSYGNRLDRYTAAVAYMDGIRPYAVYMRGYYMGSGSERQTACAISFDGERLECTHSFDTYDVNNYALKNSSSSYRSDGTYKGVDGYRPENAVYPGEGNHNCTVADVDGDSKDDVLTGAICYEFDSEDRLAVKWCTFLEHGDALHIGDYDPTHDGYEFFTVHEDGGINKFNKNALDYGMSVIDAKTGSVMFHRGASGDTGRGMMANVGAGGYYQFWGAGTYRTLGGDRFEAANVTGASSNFRIFWDGDLYDELMDGQLGRPLTVTAWNGRSMNSIFTTKDCISINGTKANPCLQADILGDWREEIVMAKADNAALRVFVSDIPTDHKIMTLMHDSVYRSGVAAEQSGYNQPPHIGFYLGETCFSGPVTALEIVSKPHKTTYNVNERLETGGLAVNIVYQNGKTSPVTDHIVSGFDPMAAGTQNVTVSYDGVSADFEVSVLTGFTTDGEGKITGFSPTGETTVIVPKSIDGKTVTGIAENALSSAEISDIYIYNEALELGEGSLPTGATVHAPDGSTAQTYCASNGISFASTSVSYSYMADVDFEKSIYTPYVGGFIVTQSAPNADTKSFEGITYGSNPRNDAWPDATTGIRFGSEDGNSFVIPVAGEFSTGGRNSWIDTDEKVELKTVSEYTFKFDILFPTDCGTLYLTLTNGSKIIDGTEMAADMQPDTWYTYTYTYNKDKQLTRTISRGNTVIDTKSLGDHSSDTYGITHIDFTRDDNGPNPSTLWGGWGNHGMGKCALAYMDNIKIYTPERSSARFTVTDAYGCAVEGADISMAGVSVKTDSNGEAKISAENGEYEAVIALDGCRTATRTVSLLDGVTPVEITLSPEYSVSFAADNIKLETGSSILADYSVKPVEKGFTEFTSSDPSVVTVDNNGVIYARSAGEADITVSSGGHSGSMHVVSAERAGDAAKIKLSGDTRYKTAGYLEPFMAVIKAEVYDSEGTLLNEPVTFTAPDGPELTQDGSGVMFRVDKELSSFTLTAVSGDASATQRIEVDPASEYAFSEFDDPLTMLQGKEAQEKALESGITLHVGNRSGGGDSFTGFKAADGILSAQAGQYNTSSRNAYITLDNSPSMNKTDEYLFRTRIRFNTGSADADVTIGDGTKSVIALSPDNKGFVRGRWYDYMLSLRGGIVTELKRDLETGEMTVSSFKTEADRISRIDITNPAGARCSVAFDDMSFSSSDSILSSATVTATDENGELIEGAVISTALDSAITQANGKATVQCYAGNNIITMTAADTEKSVMVNVSSVYTPVNIRLGEERTEIHRLVTGGQHYLVTNPEDHSLEIYRAVYEDDILTDIKRISRIKGKSVVSFSGSDTEEGRIFVWDNNMRPITDPIRICDADQ